MVKKKNSPEYGINGLNSISEIEVEIMKLAWKYKSMSVREAHEELLKKEFKEKNQGFIPYTTVMSTITTLTQKGLLRQDKDAKTYMYAPMVGKKELANNIVKSVSEKLLDSALSSLVSRLIEDPKNISMEEIKKYLDRISE
jgi:predicted transcriptional regulator